MYNDIATLHTYVLPFICTQFVKNEYPDCLDGACQLIKLQEDVPHITLRADTACLDQWKMSEIISSQVYYTYI